MASAANTNKWAHYISVNEGEVANRGVNRGYHWQSKEIGERKFTDLLEAYHIVGASLQRKRKHVHERNAMHKQKKERTERKVAEEDQNN
jgi:hypothetical protein